MSRRNTQAQSTIVESLDEAIEQEIERDEAIEEQEEGETEPTLDANAEAHAAAVRRRQRRAEASEIDLKARYPHLVSVAQRGPNGPTRVVIECDDPQTRLNVSVCEGSREIAVQDLFQVHRCAACQDRVVRKARRARTAARDKALRAAARAK